MGTYRKWKRHEDTEIAAMYERGVSYRDIAKSMGCKVGPIAGKIHHWGMANRRGGAA